MQNSFKEIVADVLHATDIVEVVGAHLQLTPAGAARFKALCPFHKEKTPSFTVNRDRQIFYCFGCERSGDAITFLRDFEGLTFKESLEKLADRAGMRLPKVTGRGERQDNLRERLLKFNEMTAKYYQNILASPDQGGPGRQHLSERALKPDTVRRFGLGYAPNSWTALTGYAKKQGFTEKELEASGLAKRHESRGLYDLFRNRLMFPIRDVSGRLVAFGGRDLGDSPAKYINSPENEVYKKSRVLYGLYEARDALRKGDHAILVEGYFDLLRCVDAGIENVVAPCGTALTKEQAALIKRYVPEVLVLFDGDQAGVRAAIRGIGILTAAGLTVRALVLPDNQDPDDFIRANGAEAFQKLAHDAQDFVTFYVRMNSDRTRSIEGRTEIAKELFAILTDVDDELRRDEYLKRLARELGLDSWTCRAEFSKFLRGKDHGFQPPAEETAREEAGPVNLDDRDFVAAILENNDMLALARETLDLKTLAEGPMPTLLKALFDGADPAELSNLEDEGARRLYAAAAASETPESDRAKALVEKRILSLKKEALRAQVERIREEIDVAVRSNDDHRVTELFRQMHDMRQEIDRVGAH